MSGILLVKEMVVEVVGLLVPSVSQSIPAPEASSFYEEASGVQFVPSTPRAETCDALVETLMLRLNCCVRHWTGLLGEGWCEMDCEKKKKILPSIFHESVEMIECEDVTLDMCITGVPRWVRSCFCARARSFTSHSASDISVQWRTSSDGRESASLW